MMCFVQRSSRLFDKIFFLSFGILVVSLLILRVEVLQDARPRLVLVRRTGEGQQFYLLAASEQPLARVVADFFLFMAYMTSGVCCIISFLVLCYFHGIRNPTVLDFVIGCVPIFLLDLSMFQFLIGTAHMCLVRGPQGFEGTVGGYLMMIEVIAAGLLLLVWYRFRVRDIDEQMVYVDYQGSLSGVVTAPALGRRGPTPEGWPRIPEARPDAKPNPPEG
jgi:hypothetical protein